MPKITAGFNLMGKMSNFDRDSFADHASMRSVEDDYIDDGHISFCQSDGKHYIYMGTKVDNDDELGHWRLYDTEPIEDNEIDEMLSEIFG